MILLSLLLTLAIAEKPIVLMHGILSSIDDLSEVETWFTKHTKSRVFNIEIGNGQSDSISKPMTWQLDEFVKTIALIPELTDGFHFVGFSQGGLLGRGYVELYNNPPVSTLLTFGTPHAGVFFWRMPKIYSEFNQEHLSYAGYYKDPHMYEVYLKNASYLPYVNNERENVIFSGDVVDVDHFVMVWSKVDGVIKPEESCKFEFFGVNSDMIIPLYKSRQYIDNLVGLRTLKETGRLHIVESSCAHTMYKTEECLDTLKDSIIEYVV